MRWRRSDGERESTATRFPGVRPSARAASCVAQPEPGEEDVRLGEVLGPSRGRRTPRPWPPRDGRGCCVAAMPASRAQTRARPWTGRVPPFFRSTPPSSAFEPAEGPERRAEADGGAGEVGEERCVPARARDDARRAARCRASRRRLGGRRRSPRRGRPRPGVVDPPANRVFPLGERSPPARRHVAARARGKAGGHEVGDHLLGEVPRSRRAALRHPVRVDEGVVLIRQERLLVASLGSEDEKGVRAGRRAEVAPRPRPAACERARRSGGRRAGRSEERAGRSSRASRPSARGPTRSREAPRGCASSPPSCKARTGPVGVVAKEVRRGDEADDAPVALDGEVMDPVLEHHLPRPVDRRSVRHRSERPARDVPRRRPGPRSAARTRLRRSRSVRIAGGSERRRTELTRSSRMTRAASRTVALGRHGDGGPFDERPDCDEGVPLEDGFRAGGRLVP